MSVLRAAQPFMVQVGASDWWVGLVPLIAKE